MVHQRCVVVVPAYNEAGRVGATVCAILGSAWCPDAVIVVDDGSRDSTSGEARAAGAEVVTRARRSGKGAAVMAGLRWASEQHGSGELPAMVVLLDADLGPSAAEAGALIEPIATGAADMSIAILPRPAGVRLGGGRVVRLAREVIRRRRGWESKAPLSGQRCLNRDALRAALPLGRGFGVETALTLDVLGAGLRVVEIDVPLEHRWTSTSMHDRLHRGWQMIDVVGAAVGVRDRSRLGKPV